jgi:hypothetical protein
MTKKLYTLSVKVREVTLPNGEVKKKYLPIGMMLEGVRGPYIILDRTFNPAGVQNPDNKTGVVVSMFEEQDEDRQADLDDTPMPF